MTRTLMQFIDPATAFGPDCRNLAMSVVRAVRRHLTLARGTIDRERRDFVIKQDLAHLDRSQLRDIGLDRGSL